MILAEINRATDDLNRSEHYSPRVKGSSPVFC